MKNSKTYKAVWAANNQSTYGSFTSKNLANALSDVKEIAKGERHAGNTAEWPPIR